MIALLDEKPRTDEEKPRTRGGKRPNAGRKKTGKRLGGPHRARPELSRHHPVHVVLRTAPWVPRLRERKFYDAIRRVIERLLGDPTFRIVHFSMQKNHLHMLVEANDRDALTTGMQKFAINAARAINQVHGSSGKVFAYRYHATQIRTARQARSSLAYVLNNWRRHREDYINGRAVTERLDGYASGATFTGWAGRPTFTLSKDYVPLPVAEPQTALLRTDWKRYGLIDLYELPGPSWW